MKYDLRTPCASCPFRSDIRPFIRAARVKEIINSNAEFACHKTCDYDEDDGGSVGPKAQHCAGLLILLEKIGRPHQMMRICERLGLYDASKLDMDAPVYESKVDAVKAHMRMR